MKSGQVPADLKDANVVAYQYLRVDVGMLVLTIDRLV